jgi:predicted GNAT family acetyltransferase
MTQPSAAITVERVEAKHRYEIRVDGTRAGLAAYRDHGAQRVFFHTEVDNAFDPVTAELRQWLGEELG